MVLEPSGSLPYDRARELEKMFTTLFQMALVEDNQLALLKHNIQEKLKEVPLAETMDRIYVDLIKFQDMHSLNSPLKNTTAIGV